MNYKQIIDENGIKQSFIADKMGVSKQFFNMCLNGKRKLPEDKKIILHNILKIK